MRFRGPHTLLAGLCCGLAVSLLARASHVGVAVVAFGLAAGAPAFGRARAVVLALALGAAGLWWGSVRLDQLQSSALAAKVGSAAPAVVEVTGPTRRGAFALRVPIVVKRFGRLSPGERARLELPLGRAPPQGALLELVASVRRPRTASDGESFNEREYLRRQGVHVVLRADGFRVIGRRGGIGAVADHLRATLVESMAPGLTGERRALIAGVVLGEDEGLSTGLRDAFRASGLYHLLAVSGQNVAFVVIGIVILCWALGMPRRLGQIAALAAVGAYVLAVGWQPSVVRAGVAGGLASLAWLAARPADRWYFLLVGAAVLLAVNPYGLLEPGFQLSFAAVAAIFVLVPRLQRRLEGYPLPRLLADAVAVSVACGLATAPILWIQFAAVPLYSVVSNALAFAVVGPLLGLAFAAAALHPVLPSAALALAWVNGWLAAYLAWCARTVGGLPHAQATSARVLGAAGLVVVFAVLLTRLRPPRLPRALALVGMAATLVVGWRLWIAESHAAEAPRGLRITILDVGQGDSTLIQVPEGAVLIDQGPPEARVAKELGALGVSRVSLLVMTHPSRDNIGGAEEVIETVPVDLVLEPDLVYENPFGDPVLAEARRRRVPVRIARAGEVFRLGDLRLEVLWPQDAGLPGGDPNDRATVILASYGDIDALLPADAEANVTLPLRPPPVEILKVSHHGSADSQLPALLELVRPQIALLSVGRGNDYGHPAPSTVAVLGRSGASVYRTDEDGSIVLESDGTAVTVRTDG